MQVNRRGLQEILTANVTYVVPLFQRPYVWEREKNWEPLWESIEAVADSVLDGRSRHHFLGAIVIEQLPTATGEMPQRQIIDGQQRLTTLQILLATFRAFCTKRSELSELADELAHYTRNKSMKAVKEEDHYKVWPTNSDRVCFTQAMSESAHPSYGVGLMASSRGYFSEAIEAWISECSARGVDASRAAHALYAAIDERLFMAVLDLEKGDDSLEIFETLNALGTPLRASDLIKNYALRMAGTLGLSLEELYIHYFKPFEDRKDFWSKGISVGRFNRNRIDVFYQYYLALKLRSDIVHEELFTRFKEYLEKNLGDIEDPIERAATLRRELEEITSDAALFLRLENLPRTDPSRHFLDLLESLETTTFMPLVLLAHKTSPDEATLRLVENAIASFLMRRMVLRITTKGYNKLVVDLMVSVQKPENGLAAVPRLLLAGKAESTVWPDDARIEEAFEDEPLYYSLKKGRIRILLERIDEALNDPLAAHVLIDGKLTVEHLMPQSWEEHWPLAPNVNEEAALEERKARIHAIGNLTLLTGSLNQAISNGPWVGKRPEILRHNSINMNRYFQGPECNVWDEEHIDARSQMLAAAFCAAFQR